MRHYEVVETIYKRFETTDVDDKIDTIELCEKPGRKPIETKPEKVKIDNRGGFRYEKKH